MTTPHPNDQSYPPGPASRRARFGLSLPWIVGLALLGLPRVVLHDLSILEEGTALNAILVFLPLLIWIVTVLVKRVPNPFLDLLAVGAGYGIVLATTHQFLWGTGFDDTPRLGGNLADLAPGTQEVIVRFFAATSSIFTGIVIGVVTGVVAWLLSTVARRRP